MKDLPEPVKVSPVIKLLRYSFLIAGILYGAAKLKTFKIIEEGKKEEKERKKLEKEARIAQEKKAASDRDIAQIVAIFTGKSETDSKTTDQSYTPEASKLETEEVTHRVEDEKSFSDDLSTCTVEEVKQMVRNDDSSPSPTVNTEFGSAEDGSYVSSDDRRSSYTRGSDSSDIFSDVFNLIPPKDRNSDVKPKVASDESGGSGSNRDAAGKASKQDGYYVEDFADGIPYAEPEAFKKDFFGKDDK